MNCKCMACRWERDCPIYSKLANETVTQQGWGPSFVIPYINVARLWRVL